MINETENIASVILPNSILSSVGSVNCQVAVYALDSRLTDPVGFYFLVVDDLSELTIETSDNVPILTDLIQQVSGIIDVFEGATWEIFNEGVI